MYRKIAGSGTRAPPSTSLIASGYFIGTVQVKKKNCVINNVTYYINSNFTYIASIFIHPWSCHAGSSDSGAKNVALLYTMTDFILEFIAGPWYYFKPMHG